MRVAERIKNWEFRRLGNIRRIIKIGWRLSLVPSLSSRSKSLVMPAKSYAEADIRVMSSCQILFDFFTLFHYFFLRDYILINEKEFPTTKAQSTIEESYYPSYKKTKKIVAFKSLRCATISAVQLS